MNSLQQKKIIHQQVRYYFVRKKNWIFGDVPCRLKIFMIFLNRTASVAFLTVMAIDRYFKVVHPHHKMNKLPKSCAVRVTGMLWILSVSISIHFLTEPHTFEHKNLTYCEPFNICQSLSATTIWTNIAFLVFEFLLPASFILFSTICIIVKLKLMKTEIRAKYKRAVKLVITVAAVFIFCFLPTNIALVAVLIAKQRSTCESYDTAVQIFYNTLCITYLNSVLDPVIYYFSSSNFKDALKKALASLNVNCCRLGTSHTISREAKREHVKLSSADKTCDQTESTEIVKTTC
ncbi:hydroxycarboxylic acid receptor 2-like isoform X2 [Heterodontus francisci]|uniref:hydroxycarboxylic acid receptor 2-like isoform X2 n=1 Tax=Heterodontus francisci TaxID=7792 RepID=UPI00355C99CE